MGTRISIAGNAAPLGSFPRSRSQTRSGLGRLFRYLRVPDHWSDSPEPGPWSAVPPSGWEFFSTYAFVLNRSTASRSVLYTTSGADTNMSGCAKGPKNLSMLLVIISTASLIRPKVPNRFSNSIPSSAAFVWIRSLIKTWSSVHSLIGSRPCSQMAVQISSSCR